MPTFPLILPTGSNVGRDGLVANARLINAYAEEVGAFGKSQYAIYGAPGLTRFDSGTYTGASRGLIELNSNALIAFLGNQVVSFDQGGVDTALGTLVGSGPLSLARNRATTPQIAIVTSASQVYNLAGGTISQVSDSDLPAPNSVTYLRGFFIYGIKDGRIFQSDLEDGTAIQSDAFGTARSDSSDLRTVKAHAGFLYVFKAEGAEIWQADPSLAGENFSFSPVQQDIDIGCGAAFSVVSLARGLAWVDDDGIVRFGRDGAAERISTHTVERDIEDLTQTQRLAIEGFSYTFQGHEIYSISSDLWTHEFDVTTKQWGERKSYGQSRWRATSCEAFSGVGAYIVGNTEDGKLFKIAPKTYSEGGDNLVAEIWCPQSHRFPNRMTADSVYLDIVGGVGLAQTGAGIHVQDGAHVDFGDVLDRTGSFTIEAIINAEDITIAGQRIVSKDDGTDGWALSLGDGSRGSLRFFHRSLNTVSTDSPSDAIKNNRSHHCAAVFDASADTLTLYVDGAQVGQTTGQTNAIAGNTNKLTVGAAPENPSQPKNFKGFVREVRIWDVARSAAEILANKSATLTGSESGLTGYWKLDEQAGAVAADSSPSGFDGNLTGDAVWSDDYWAPLIDPAVMVDYSDDGGANFEGERTAKLGKIGERRQRVKWDKWGLVDVQGRIWRFRISAAVLRGVIEAYVTGRAVT
jgi:hypothetical protein